MNESLLLAFGSAAGGGAVAVGAPAVMAGVDRLNRGTQARLHVEMSASGMDPSRLPLFLRAWRGATVGVVVLVGLGLEMPPVALFLGFLVHKLGPLWLQYQAAAHRRRMTEQVIIAARSLAGQVQAGLPLGSALTLVAEQSPEPLGSHLRRTIRQLDQGTDIREALDELKDRISIDAVALFVIALQVATGKGGKLGDVLERIGRSLDELGRVQRKRNTDTAAGRLMVFLLAAFPAVFLGFFYIADPDMTRLVFDRLAGQIVLSVVGVLVYISVRWAGRILDRVE